MSYLFDFINSCKEKTPDFLTKSKKQSCEKCNKHPSIKTKYLITDEIIDNKLCLKCYCGRASFYIDARN